MDGTFAELELDAIEQEKIAPRWDRNGSHRQFQPGFADDNSLFVTLLR